MIKTKQVGFWVVGLLLVLVVSGCAFGDFGRTANGGFGIDEPTGIIGQNKSSVLTTLGVPGSVVVANDTEYWGYRNKAGWFVLVGGVTREKDIVVEFKGNKAVAAYLVDQGKSFGIFTAQGTVAN